MIDINDYKKLLGENILRIEFINENLYVHISSVSLLKCMSILNSHSDMQFLALTDCFAVDFIEKNGTFSIYYQLHSYKLETTIFVVTNLREDEMAQSVTEIFVNANWYEREIFDMFGIKFKDHPNMTRILSNDSVCGFSLLKKQTNFRETE